MDTLATTIQNNYVYESSIVDPVSANLAYPEESLKVQLPQTRIGLGSTESDLIVFVKKYLEIVGLVFFVWLLGKQNYSFIYLFQGV